MIRQPSGWESLDSIDEDMVVHYIRYRAGFYRTICDGSLAKPDFGNPPDESKCSKCLTILTGSWEV